ncbi:MAG: galactokinase [Bacteroidota bacterium]
MISNKIEKYFSSHFSASPRVIVKAPGRINIIGEHTDYNSGYVLPAAINYYMNIGLSKNGTTDKINLYSLDYDEYVSASVEEIKRTENDWLNLIYGVVFQLKDYVKGFDLAFGGNIPVGAGVSSSAALCCGVALGLSELFELNLEKWELARIAQKSEHTFSLVQCGIMDQFACLFGLVNHVLLLNCLSLEYEETTIDLSGSRLLLINSNVKHNLGDSDYNKRREESTQALEFFKTKFPNVKTYQDLSLEMVNRCKEDLAPKLWKRVHHIVSENGRVLMINEALKNKDHVSVGNQLTQGHMSLKNDFEVTCNETDYLVNELISHDQIYGARQVGGGFGGCVLALSKDVSLDSMIEDLDQKYTKDFNLNIDDIPIKISNGCHRVA